MPVATPLTWGLKATVAGICVLWSIALLLSRRANSYAAVCWLLFLTATAVSSGLYALIEARPMLDRHAIDPVMLSAVNFSAGGAWLAGGDLLDRVLRLRPMRADIARFLFRLGGFGLAVGLPAAVFTSQPPSERLDYALTLASIGGLGMLAGAIAGIASPGARAAGLGAPSALVLLGVLFTGAGFALCEGWLSQACGVPAHCPLPRWLQPEAIEHASLAAACVALGAAAWRLLDPQRGRPSKRTGDGHREPLVETAGPGGIDSDDTV